MARIIDQVRGHEDTLFALLKGFSNERPGQTWLFVGPSGVGKKLTAMGLAQALVCENSKTACGRCGSCLRVHHQQSESVLLVQKESAQIKIDQAHQILQFLQLANIGKSRVIIIDDVQSLNIQAANSLLKVFEEPPENTYFFLIAPSTAGILPTIRSRARMVYFHPLKISEMNQIQTAPDWALRAAAGSIEKLKSLLDPEEQRLRSEAGKVLMQFCQDSDFLLDPTWKENLKDRASASRILSYWVSYVRDALILAQNGKHLLQNPDQLQLIKYLSDQKTSPWLYYFIEKAMQLENEVARNLDIQLAYESFWVLMKKEKNHVFMD